MDLAIVVCILLSYAIGSKAILDNKYRPSIYSRIIWLLFALNNFISVLILKNSTAVLILAGLGLLGNSIILVLSLKKSKQTFGMTEKITSLLLLVSLAVWIFTKLPLLNLTIGIIAHFIGGIPTYKNVLKNPKEEVTLFWFFFFLASALTLLKVEWNNISNYLYPLYFALFDGLMTLLCFRRYKFFQIRRWFNYCMSI